MSHRTVVEHAFQKVKDRISRGKVLEVGCAGGEFHHMLRPLGFEWYGIDIKEGNPFPPKEPNNFVTCDMQDLKYWNKNEFDLIFACHSFEHIPFPLKALTEFGRVLKSEGYIFIGMPRFSEKQILKMDEDHINILHPWQMERYCKFLTWIHQKDKFLNFEDLLGKYQPNVQFILEEQFEELMNPPNKDDGQDSQIYLIKVIKSEINQQ